MSYMLFWLEQTARGAIYVLYVYVFLAWQSGSRD